jgi:hypothetical protein
MVALRCINRIGTAMPVVYDNLTRPRHMTIPDDREQEDIRITTSIYNL